jgi:hypothetical protein
VHSAPLFPLHDRRLAGLAAPGPRSQPGGGGAEENGGQAHATNDPRALAFAPGIDVNMLDWPGVWRAKNLGYDPAKDLVPVATAFKQPAANGRASKLAGKLDPRDRGLRKGKSGQAQRQTPHRSSTWFPQPPKEPDKVYSRRRPERPGHLFEICLSVGNNIASKNRMHVICVSPSLRRLYALAGSNRALQLFVPVPRCRRTAKPL